MKGGQLKGMGPIVSKMGRGDPFFQSFCTEKEKNYENISSSQTPHGRTRRSSRPEAVRCAVLSRMICAAALAVLSAPHGLSADEMTEAEAIKEIERLGGEVYRSTPPPDPTRPTAPAPFMVAKVQDPRLGEQVRLLNHLPALEAVGIKAARIDDDDLAGLDTCARLRSLGVVGSQRAAISDGALEHIADARSLTDLDLGMAAVQEAGFAQLAELENLEQLRASGSGVTDAALSSLAMLTKLKRLTLSDTAVTNAGVAELRRLANLQQLSIHSKGIRDAAIGELKGLNLTELDIGDGITDASLGDLGVLRNLTSLSLAGMPITDAGLKRLSPLKSLARLDLRGTKFSDVGVESIHTLARLAELNLEHTRITDAGLDQLQRFERVPTLYLLDTAVTDAGMDDLQRATGARILSWPGQSPVSGTSSGRRSRRLRRQ